MKKKKKKKMPYSPNLINSTKDYKSHLSINNHIPKPSFELVGRSYNHLQMAAPSYKNYALLHVVHLLTEILPILVQTFTKHLINANEHERWGCN